MLKILFAYRVRSEIENESDEDIFVILVGRVTGDVMAVQVQECAHA